MLSIKMQNKNVYTKEMHMREKLKEYKLSEQDAKTILDEFSKTKDQYYRLSILHDKPIYMTFKEIIQIIAEKNGIKLIICE